MRRRLADLFTRLGNRDGQALLLIAGAMALILIVSAFVVDVSHAFVDQRHLRNCRRRVPCRCAAARKRRCVELRYGHLAWRLRDRVRLVQQRPLTSGLGAAAMQHADPVHPERSER